jgi:uroporphyrinogen III methyltransferase/synthase
VRGRRSGLLTVRAQQLLATCDAIAADALANPAIVEAARADNPDVEVHDVGKRGGSGESARQEAINDLLVRLGREGKRVVRLKGGDPLVFGRGSEEAQALAEARVRFEIVPGVTAGVAAAAYAGIPSRIEARRPRSPSSRATRIRRKTRRRPTGRRSRARAAPSCCTWA